MGVKVAYLTGEYPRATDTFIQREVAGLRAAGLDVLTCSIRRTGAEHHVGPEQKDEAARTFHVLEAAKNPLRLLATHGRLFWRGPGRYLKALALAWRTSAPGIKARAFQMFYFAEAGMLARHVQGSGAQRIHNHIAMASSTVAMLAARLANVPFSFTLHGPDIFFEPHRWRLDAKIAEASFVACISNFCRSQAMAFSPEADWSKLQIIHCGVDPARYGARAKTSGKRLLFVGRLAAVKGIPVLVEAMEAVRAAHPDVQLDIIGDGPDRAALEARAAPLGQAVRFLGYRSQQEVAEALSSADVFVLPSFAEGVPVVLMEAMAARVVPVTTRIAGVPELIEDGVSGRLVAPGDAAAMAEALITVLDDPQASAAMGDAGRAKVVADFDAATEAAKLARLLEAI